MVPLHIALERADLNDVVVLFAWNVQMIEFVFDLTQRHFAFARELEETDRSLSVFCRRTSQKKLIANFERHRA